MTTIKLITRETVAEKLAAHLHHELSLESLVAWVESAMMDGDFDPAHLLTIRGVVTRIGGADVRAFGLTWKTVEPHGDTSPKRILAIPRHRGTPAHIPLWLHPPQLTSAEKRATAASR